MSQDTELQRKKTSWLVAKLGALVVAMFAFGWAMIPLYDLICEVTGLGGRTGDQYTYDPAQMQPDTSRLVRVSFLANTNAGMTWEFKADRNSVRVHPGEVREVNFIVRNTSDRPMVGQAIPSLIPGNAVNFFHKTECFCFEYQLLEPGESMEMPLRFVVDPDLPPNVDAVTLSYALFDITDMALR